ncbi:hypothetical protein PC121_g19333 [Phytophthora cactorum]|nr:hypothetical protein PC121_g19333 [Phytophthora cactorum]
MVGHKARVWTEKELAWLKVRQLLIEEEEKTSTHKRRHAKSVERSAVRSEASDGSVSDNEITSSKSSRSLSGYSGNTPTRWQLLATLEQVTKTCQRMKLSDATMARVSEHLNSIDQIVREDMSSHQSRSRRLSSTQASNDSSDSLDTYSVVDIPSSHPRGDVAPTVRDSFKAFASGQDLRDKLAASNNLVADCGLDGTKLQEPWHVYYHIRGAVYSKLSFRHKQLFKLLEPRICSREKDQVQSREHAPPVVIGRPGSGISRSEGLVQEFLQIPNVLSREHTTTSGGSTQGGALEENGGNLFYNIKTEPQIPVAEYTAVHGATGTNDKTDEPAGITRFVLSRDESLDIACYFLNLETTEEMKRKEFSWTTRLKHHMLDEMRDVGIDLENIVYSRGDIQYLIMTPKRHNLLYPSITTL